MTQALIVLQHAAQTHAIPMSTLQLLTLASVVQ